MTYEELKAEELRLCEKLLQVRKEIAEAEEWANDYLPDYSESMSHAAFGWDEEYTEEEYDEYTENCGYEIEESEEDE